MITQTPQIKNSTVIATETLGNLHKIDYKFEQVVKNTKNFNGKRLKYKTKIVANGKQFLVYSPDGDLLIEWSLLADRNSYELTAITYER